VAKAHGLLLAHVGELDHLRDPAANGEQIHLAALFQAAFELRAEVEVIFDGRLAAAGDNDDLIAPGGEGFFDTVLDDGLVDERQHFLGNGFGGGQKASAKSGGGEYRLTHFGLVGHLQVQVLPRRFRV
jgi:hypothetical protein